MFEVTGVRTIDVLYRVSTRAQETSGDSLYNQRREVEEKWAAPRGIAVRRRIEVAESGKGALRLVGDSFVFSKRAEYTAVIVEYQTMRPNERPDAIAIDWVDRWSRNVFEYSGLVMAFRILGIRLLAIGDSLDLTDPRNDLVTHVRAAIGQEQLRIIKEKVSEARRSRRERGKWQGGNPPDGLRTHEPECPGLITRYRDSPDGVRHSMRVRGCDCDATKLWRDPERENTYIELWKMLATSPLSWQAMVDDINAAGLRRQDGKMFRWNDLYRIGENPHYAGIMTSERWVRDAHDGTIKRRKKLEDQQLIRDSNSIIVPYVSEDTFWAVQRARYGKHTRNLPRAKSGSVSELTGILVCPVCSNLMSSLVGRSSKKTGHGNPRLSPIKIYTWMWCMNAQGKVPTCTNKQRVQVAPVSAVLIAEIQRIATLSDEAILAALQLQQAQDSSRALEAERVRLVKSLATADAARHSLTKLFSSGALSQSDVEAELFAHRRDRTAAEHRIREIDTQLARDHARPDFAEARKIISWLREHWSALTVPERAEALRLLIGRATYVPTTDSLPTNIFITEYGAAFVESSLGPRTLSMRLRRLSSH